jgi:hypothetical protein
MTIAHFKLIILQTFLNVLIMTNYLQSEFNKFHANIKLYDNDENKDLREKRDILTKELKDYFAKKAKDEETKEITFSIANQGSYSMGTGIKPIGIAEYDIDVMVLFNFSKNDYPPVEVKKWVFEALNVKNRTVDYKKPCVRVQYHNNGEDHFHVDLALYANVNSDGKTYLSKGKPNSTEEEKKWEISNPKLLKENINTKFTDSDDCLQMKRSIRYLKRWKDNRYKTTENGKPTGIAITALVYNLFQPEIDRNQFDSSVKPKDLVAVKKLVAAIIRNFSLINGRIHVYLPVEPYNDLFEKLTDKQNNELQEKLKTLYTALENAENEPDPHLASKILIKEFGDDFPEVDKDKSAQKRDLAFPGKSESA